MLISLRYLSYVTKMYNQLAKQMVGYYFKDGGPVNCYSRYKFTRKTCVFVQIFGVQLDNETPDLEYDHEKPT